MSSPDLVAARAAVLDPRPCRYRTFTWWSTLVSDDKRRAKLGAPSAELFNGTHYHRWYQAASGQMPRLLATHAWPASAPSIAAATKSIDIVNARTWLFTVPTGAVVAGLQLDFHDLRTPDEPRPILELFDDVDSGRETLLVAGQPVLHACLKDGAEDLGLDLEFAGDMHHFLCFGPDREGELPFNRDLLQRMVSRRDEPSRPRYLTATFPRELNRYRDGFAAVTPGATVLGGQIAAVEVAACMNAILALSSLAALRGVQQCAFQALEELRDARFNDATWVTDRIAELRGLELDLSFGVEAHLEMRILVPSLPIEQLHHDLVDALALRRGTELAGGMLARLSAAIAAEDARLQIKHREAAQARADENARHAAEERRLASRRRRAVAAAVGVGGILALPLTFLGSNDTEVQKNRSMFDLGHYWPYYSTFLVLILVAVVVVWTVGHRFDPDESPLEHAGSRRMIP
jgi:hypothetical protein